MRKKVVSVLLTAAMTATMLAGCGNKQTADSQLGESYEETMAAVQSEEAATKETETTAEAKELDYSERVDLVFYLLGDAPAGLDRVEDKINEILLEKANATVDFQFSTWTDWGEKYKLQLTTGGVDLIYTASWNNFGQLAQSGAFLPLDDLLETAEGILFGGEPDNGLLPFICRLDSKAEVHDEKNWEKANPSLRYLPDLMEEIRKEYRDWLKRPEKFTAFMTKRMNLPDGSSEIKVCAYERIKATNRPVPVDDLVGRMCTCGIDFSKVTDMISVNLHFRDVDTRYDLNHSWLCLQSKDLPRIKAPWKEWADQGHITLVDDVEIHPELIVDYIATQMEYYSIKKMAIDDFRYALVAKYLQNIGFDAKV